MWLEKRVKAELRGASSQVQVWSGVKISPPLFLVNSSFIQNLLSYPSVSLPLSLTTLPDSPPWRPCFPTPHQQERAGGPCRWQNYRSFLSLTHCVILGKSHVVSEPQVSPPNSLGLYGRDGGLNIDVVSDFLPKEGFLNSSGRRWGLW